ncbi:COX15/CtaA family protein [Neptuniibacter caesariensis]|nr:COX15/CtaA family protein [Neptuniibacter caesariensis]
MKRYAWITVNIATGLALCVVLLGAWTRINDAGLSCPDWPGCYGHMIMPSQANELELAQQAFPQTPIELPKTHLEMGHRYLAGILGFLIAGLALIAYQQKHNRAYPHLLSYLLLMLVTIQAAFGMWTVTLKLYPPVVTLHLLGGMFTLLLLIVLRKRIEQLNDGKVSDAGSYPRIVKVALVALILQIAAGGWTSSNYAGPACEHWLSCNPGSAIEPDFGTGFDPTVVIGPDYQGGYLPIEARAAIQIGHRLGALAVLVVCIGLLVKLRKVKPVAGALVLLATTLFAQLLLGVLNVVWAVPALLAMLHHGFAVVLVLILLHIGFKASAVKEVS